MNKKNVVKKNKNSKRKANFISNTIIRIYYLLFLAFWGVIMYNMVPPETSDLGMYYEKFESFSRYFKTYRELFEYNIKTSGDFIFYSIIYFMSIFKMDKHLFPVIIMIFYYSTILYMYMNSEKNEKIKTGQGIIVVILTPCLVYPYLLLSVLRFPLALAFFSLGLFFSFEKNQPKKGILLYLMAYFTHTAMGFGIILLFIFKHLNNFGRFTKFMAGITTSFVYLLLRFKLDLVITIISNLGFSGVGNKLKNSAGRDASIGVGLGPAVVLICTFILINLIIYRDKENELVKFLKVLSVGMVLTTSLTLMLLLRYTWFLVFLLPYISKKIEIAKIYFILLGLNMILFLYVYRLYIVENFTSLL